MRPDVFGGLNGSGSLGLARFEDARCRVGSAGLGGETAAPSIFSLANAIECKRRQRQLAAPNLAPDEFFAARLWSRCGVFDERRRGERD